MPSSDEAAEAADEEADERALEDEGEPSDLRENLIVKGAVVEAEYPLGVLAVGEGAERKFVAACAVGESADGSVIVAFPGKCWNRAAAKRVVGLDFVRKVSAARVRCASAEDRDRPLEGDLRICLGLLTAEGEAAFDFAKDFDTEIEIHFSFGTSEQPELLPHAGSLAELARGSFEFLTAESGVPEQPEPPVRSKGPDLEKRLNKLEGCFESIQADLKKLVSAKAEAGAPSAASDGRTKAKTAPSVPARKPVSTSLEGMDPGVVRAALDSGIDLKHIEEMGRFLRGQGKPTADEPRATAKLAEGKRKESSLEALLDGSGSADASSGPTSSRKNAAALRALRDRLRSHPKELIKVVERNMESDFALRSVVPGSSQVPVSCRAWLESRSRVQHYPSTIRFLWIIAGVADALREDNREEAYLRCLLGLAAGDQLSIDRGSWNVAGEMLLEDPPPFPSFTTHTLPSGAEIPFTKLVDARWMELFMSRLREVDLYLETRRKLAGQSAAGRRSEDGGVPPPRGETEENAGAPRRPPKGKGRGSRGGAMMEPVRVPGSGATTVDPVALWKALPRLLLAGDNSFAVFFSSYFRCAQDRPEPGHTASSPWPMPLPYFGACDGEKNVSESLNDGRQESALKVALNMIVASLSWLHLGRPREAPLAVRGFRHLSSEQWAHVNRLAGMMRDIVCHSPVSAEDMGRVASKIENLEDVASSLRKKADRLAVLCRGYGHSSGAARVADPVEMDFVQEVRGSLGSNMTAKPVVASRLEFGEAPKFNPSQYMDALSLDHYLYPIDHSVPEDQCPEAPPRARILATPVEKLALFRKLDQGGRLRFLPATITRQRCLNGLFSVPKSLAADRLILDARGPNLLEAGLNRWTQSLGCAEALLQIRLAEGEVLVLSGADLKDYYYHYCISSQRLIRNALAGHIDESTARSFSCFEEHLSGKGPYRASLNSMAMGDLNSVEFGQLAHLALSLQAKVFSPEEMLTLRSRAPRSSIAGGVVIDDLFITEKLPRSDIEALGSGATAGALRLRRAEEAYAASGLKQNFKKSFREQLKADVWGAEVDGDRGTCRPLACRLIPVISITVDIIKTRAATRHILASIAGFFVAVFQFRRRCMSLLEEVFKAPRWLDEHKAFRIWPALEAELWMLVLISPAVRANLRNGYCPEVSATDASDRWEAEVSQLFPEEFVEELSRHSLKKSVWTKLLRPVQMEARVAGTLDPAEELPGGDSFGYHPVWQTLFRSVQFKEVWRRRIWRPRHINVHELRTLIASERRRGLRSPCSRVVSASDSQVSLGAVLKGRSASPRLNGILRQSLPEHLSSDISGVYAYVGTSDNPADDPTRHAPVRAAREAMPLWLEHALGGRFEELEVFLKGCELDAISMLGLPPLDSIVPLAVSEPKAPRNDRRLLFMKELKRSPSPPEAEVLAEALLRADRVTAEDLLGLFELLPSEVAARGMDVEGSGSFSGGLFVHEGVVGVRRASRSFPLSCAVVSRFVESGFPEHEYTSFTIMKNVKTVPHRDSHNSSGSKNLVIGLSSFVGGAVWVADDQGDIEEEIDNRVMRGRDLEVSLGAVTLDPRQWHFTREWKGDRTVLVMYTIRDFLKASFSDIQFLAGLGFHFPASVFLKHRSLKPPPSVLPAERCDLLVAGKERELEQPPRVEADFEDGPVLDLPYGLARSLLEFDPDQFVLPKRCKQGLHAMLRRPGFLDCYSGSRGVAHELANLSGTWVLTFDYARSSSEDLLDAGLQEKIFSLVRGHAFLGGGAGPVCSSFSRAVRPNVRSKELPLGLQNVRASMQQKVHEGNLHASFSAALAREFGKIGRPVWVENPHGSYLWNTPWWEDLLKDRGAADCWVLDFCAFGAPWRKRTRFYVGAEAGGQIVRCPGCAKHQQLKGYSSFHRRQWTKVAEAYPRQVNTILAYHLANKSLPPALRRRLNLAACAKCHGARFGEASHPGPVLSKQKLQSLEDVKLVSAATAKLQVRVVDGFEEWLLQGLSDSALKSLATCAMAYCSLLRAYGDFLFRSGQPMYMFRHLLAYMQKQRLELRPYMPMAWDLLSRWERVQPVRHRIPMPEAIFQALFALGALRGWFRWCAILGLAYFGIARAGEPLRAQRKDLLLPSDTLSPISVGVFMAVRSPKTAFRGKGRVQHLCIKDTGFCSYLESVYARASPEDLLYNGSPSAFRKRWDELLRILAIPRSVSLTPGGLRGGGAVRAYREGLGIQDLMWRMRVRHATTLESYLQEVAALSVVPKLSADSRRRVAAACAFYQPALNSSSCSSG
ncbi:unnamed protein product [Symbiodinium sp. CCMP2456]|nr:unnamed protein product [Symbiodinium sp. CCMP2456]